MSVKTATEVARKLAAGDFGYGQDDRRSAWRDNGKLGPAGLREPGDIDCSFSVALIWFLAGMIDRAILLGTIFTGNIAAVLARTGMFDLIDVRHLTLAQIRAKARRNDSLLGVGHIMFHLGANRYVSFETTEKGRSTGGKLGDQTGREGRVRGIYLRSASSRAAGESRTGWVVLIRPKSIGALLNAVVAAYGAGRSITAALVRLARRAPVRVKWAGEFMAAWERLDRGAELTFEPVPVSASGHAFVVLGAGLGKRGQITEEFARRLRLALAAAMLNPASTVLVTGGKPQNGTTEAEAGRDWLIDHGLAASRVLVEEASASTIGNALGSVPILIGRGVVEVTIVTDASHARRALTLFLAARTKTEMASLRAVPLAFTAPLVFNDYGAKPVKSALPVTAATRATVAAEVTALFNK